MAKNTKNETKLKFCFHWYSDSATHCLYAIKNCNCHITVDCGQKTFLRWSPVLKLMMHCYQVWDQKWLVLQTAKPELCLATYFKLVCLIKTETGSPPVIPLEAAVIKCNDYWTESCSMNTIFYYARSVRSIYKPIEYSKNEHQRPDISYNYHRTNTAHGINSSFFQWAEDHQYTDLFLTSEKEREGYVFFNTQTTMTIISETQG